MHIYIYVYAFKDTLTYTLTYMYIHTRTYFTCSESVHLAAYTYSVSTILSTSRYNSGTIVLPPGRVTADLQFAGDACEALLGTYSVRGKVALVDRGRCSFVQKVCAAL